MKGFPIYLPFDSESGFGSILIENRSGAAYIQSADWHSDSLDELRFIAHSNLILISYFVYNSGVLILSPQISVHFDGVRVAEGSQ